MKVAQTITSCLMFLLSLDLYGRASSYLNASKEVDAVEGRLERLIVESAKEQDLIVIWGDYNSIIEQAPLISTTTYERNKDRLNSLFSERVSSRSQ